MEVHERTKRDLLERVQRYEQVKTQWEPQVRLFDDVARACNQTILEGIGALVDEPARDTLASMERGVRQLRACLQLVNTQLEKAEAARDVCSRQLTLHKAACRTQGLGAVVDEFKA